MLRNGFCHGQRIRFLGCDVADQDIGFATLLQVDLGLCDGALFSISFLVIGFLF